MAARKVLLIVNAGFGDLVASAASAKRIRDCLHGHGFVEPVCYVDRDATIANVHAWLSGPGRTLGEDDVLVVYFVGHGEIVRDPNYERTHLDQRPRLADVSLLITHDVHDPRSTEAGILGVDLVAWLAPIAEATGNVTLILDCCHATGMVPGQTETRAPQRRVRAAQDRVKRLVRMKYDTYRGTDKQTAAHEHRIVRLVATTQNEFAEEGPGIVDGKDIGLFSDALADSLGQPSAAQMTWEDHILRVQRLVLARSEAQRPGVEGPRHRLPFSTEVRDPGESSPCQFEASGSLTLIAGLAHGVETGDTYEVVHTNDPIPLMEVTVFAAGVARSAMHGAPPYERVESGLRAIPRARARPMNVAIQTRHTRHGRLIRAAVPARFGVAFDDTRPADATLELHDDVSILRYAGDIVHLDGPIDDTVTLHWLILAVARVAHWHRIERGLRELAALTTAPVVVEAAWGTMNGPLADPAPTLSRTDAVWATVRSVSYSELFVSAFHIRGDRGIVHLTEDLDHGQTFLRSRDLDMTQTASGTRSAWPLRRGPGLWDHRRVRESIVLFVSPTADSYHGVATPQYKTTRSTSIKPVFLGTPPAIVRLDFHLDPDRP